MRSWKTTLGGLLSAVGAWMSNQADPWWCYKFGPLVSVVGLTLLGLTARDNNVPSEAVKGAVRRQTELYFEKPPEPGK